MDVAHVTIDGNVTNLTVNGIVTHLTINGQVVHLRVRPSLQDEHPIRVAPEELGVEEQIRGELRTLYPRGSEG